MEWKDESLRVVSKSHRVNPPRTGDHLTRARGLSFLTNGDSFGRAGKISHPVNCHENSSWSLRDLCPAARSHLLRRRLDAANFRRSAKNRLAVCPKRIWWPELASYAQFRSWIGVADKCGLFRNPFVHLFRQLIRLQFRLLDRWIHYRHSDSRSRPGGDESDLR